MGEMISKSNFVFMDKVFKDDFKKCFPTPIVLKV